jgi:hypothetical protein
LISCSASVHSRTPDQQNLANFIKFVLQLQYGVVHPELRLAPSFRSTFLLFKFLAAFFRTKCTQEERPLVLSEQDREERLKAEEERVVRAMSRKNFSAIYSPADIKRKKEEVVCFLKSIPVFFFFLIIPLQRLPLVFQYILMTPSGEKKGGRREEASRRRTEEGRNEERGGEEATGGIDVSMSFSGYSRVSCGGSVGISFDLTTRTGSKEERRGRKEKGGC